MALPAAAIWEIRADATANNVNGGGFNAARGGTDYSQQTGSQLTNTDGSATGTTTFTSALATFTSQMVGNYLHIVSSTGLTAGWYEIVTFTDANNVVLDRTPGTGTAATFHVGGAMSMNSTLDDEMFEAAVAGNIFYVRGDAGTVTVGEAVSVTTAGSETAPIKVIGYDTSRSAVPTGDDRPLISAGANGLVFGNDWQGMNFRITGTSAPVYQCGTRGRSINVKAINTSTSINRDAIASHPNGILLNCEMVSYRGDGFSQTGAVTLTGCYIHDSNRGVDAAFSSFSMTHTIISSCVAGAYVFSSGTAATPTRITNCTFYGSENTTGTGVSVVTGNSNIVMLDTIIYGFVTGVSHADATNAAYEDYNDFNNNDTNRSNWSTGANSITTAPAFASVGQVTGTAGAFTAANDRLVDTSKNFTSLGVVAGVDNVYIVSGTGVTAGIYGVSSITTTTNPNDTLVLDLAPGTNTTGDKVYQITIGHNFAITGDI